MLVLIFGSKSGLGNDFGESDTKKTLLHVAFYCLFGQTPLRNNITMATAKVPDDQNLFEIVCCVLI